MVPWVDHSKTTLKGMRVRKIHQGKLKKKIKITGAGLDSAQFDLIWTKLLLDTNRFFGCCEARLFDNTKGARKNKIYLVYVVFERLLAPYRPPIVEA